MSDQRTHKMFISFLRKKTIFNQIELIKIDYNDSKINLSIIFINITEQS